MDRGGIRPWVGLEQTRTCLYIFRCVELCIPKWFLIKIPLPQKPPANLKRAQSRPVQGLAWQKGESQLLGQRASCRFHFKPFCTSILAPSTFAEVSLYLTNWFVLGSTQGGMSLGSTGHGWWMHCQRWRLIGRRVSIVSLRHSISSSEHGECLVFAPHIQAAADSSLCATAKLCVALCYNRKVAPASLGCSVLRRL